MDLPTILTGIGAVVAAIGGIFITVHEVRRRARRVTRKEIEDLTDEIEALRERERREVDSLIGEVDALRRLLLEQRQYIYRVVTIMIDHGIDVPPPPAPSFDPGEYDP